MSDQVTKIGSEQTLPTSQGVEITLMRNSVLGEFAIQAQASMLGSNY